MAANLCVHLLIGFAWYSQTVHAQYLDDETCLMQTPLTQISRHQPKADSDSESPPEGLSGFEGTYQWTAKDGSKRTYKFKGLRPTGDGDSPVYVYINGLFDQYAVPQDFVFLEYMARKGFAAAVLEYENGGFCQNVCQKHGACSPRADLGNMTTHEKANNIKSALDVLCAADYSDCSKGLAVTGDSQGGFIAMELARVDPRVSALMLMGVGRIEGWGWPKEEESCISDKSMSKHLPPQKRRIIDGGDDDHFLGKHHTIFQELSGYQCDWKGNGPVDCIQDDGSGYYIMAASEETAADQKSLAPPTNVDGFIVQNKLAGHDFFSSLDPATSKSVLLPSFKDGAEDWCMKPNLDWLAAAAQVASPLDIEIAEDAVSMGDAKTEEAAPKSCAKNGAAIAGAALAVLARMLF